MSDIDILPLPCADARVQTSEHDFWAVTVAPLIHRLRAHPLVQRCRQGRASRAELQGLVLQLGHYGNFRVRLLCALISTLEPGEDLLVCESLSRQVDAKNPRSAALHQQLLRSLELEPGCSSISARTQQVVDTTFMLCRMPGGAAGLGALALGTAAVLQTLYTDVLHALREAGTASAPLQYFHAAIERETEQARVTRDVLRRLMQARPVAWREALQAAEQVLHAWQAWLDDVVAAAGPVRETSASATSHGPQSWIHKRVLRRAQGLPAAGQPPGVPLQRHVELPSRALRMKLTELEPRQSTARERAEHETMLYILRGGGVTVIDEHSVEWEEGDAVYIPACVWYQHRNLREDEDALYLACEGTVPAPSPVTTPQAQPQQA
ncbi:cupin domain-containing protein [Caldimonas brevitalea]|uniref:Cupin type-2 domain-containing protein n=1 Tax=Caldimonas brevitalea TaxID=413882 RepID=A0A0G3BWH1_9BURK|nr:cupin domain-containing protein [Caldimonas brevitalea]AKJ30860.1 hypothetical protein AAW51_4169 [Caldimonas brevitalea]